MDRGITPSDIDMFIESGGCFLFCELSRDAESLNDLPTGQRIAFRNLARLPGIHCVALLRHGLMSISRQIDTATDIKSATVTFHAGTKAVAIDGDEWQRFAVLWSISPVRAIREVLEPKLAATP